MIAERLIRELRAEFLLREEELKAAAQDRPSVAGKRATPRHYFRFHRATDTGTHQGRPYAYPAAPRPVPRGAYSTKDSDLGQRIEIPASLVGKRLTSDQPVRISDLTAPDYRDRYVPIKGYTGKAMRSLLAVPIKVHETMVGVLNAESTRADAFTSVHEDILAAIAAQVAIALQRSPALRPERLVRRS